MGYIHKKFRVLIWSRSSKLWFIAEINLEFYSFEYHREYEEKNVRGGGQKKVRRYILYTESAANFKDGNFQPFLQTNTEHSIGWVEVE